MNVPRASPTGRSRVLTLARSTTLRFGARDAGPRRDATHAGRAELPSRVSDAASGPGRVLRFAAPRAVVTNMPPELAATVAPSDRPRPVPPAPLGGARAPVPTASPATGR